VGAIMIFGERPSALALAGSALVVTGIVVMTWAPGRTTGTEVRRAVTFALLTGACIAAYTLWDSKGVEIVPPVLYSTGLDISRVACMAPLALATQAGGRTTLGEVMRTQRSAVIAIGVLSPGAYLLVLIALTIAPVSYVAPAREISILFGAVLGLRLLGESDALRRLLGAGAIVGGVFALALG
jgi:drug/metabolite transporter (DMT)-like permease